MTAGAERESHEDARLRAALKSIVELGDGALTERLAELEEAATLLGNLDREQRLALGAEVTALGHVAQPIEVQIRAAVDRHIPVAVRAAAGHMALDAGDCERAGRLEDRASILEHILDRRTDLITTHQHDLIDVAPRELEGLFADTAYGNAVGEHTDTLECDALALAQRLVHCRRVFRLHPDDLHARIKLLDVGTDATDQPAATDRHEDGIDLTAALAHQLHADGALSGNHVRVIEGMHEHQMALASEREGVLLGGIVDVTVQ